MIRQRIGEFDLVGAFSTRAPKFVVQVGFGLACFAGTLAARAGIDIVAPGAGPFSLLYLAVLISSLYGRLLSGVVTWLAGFLHAWYFILPPVYSFTFANPVDGPRTVVNGILALLIGIFADIFRRAVRRASVARDAELETNQLLMRELEHRTKNNFAMVAGLLNLQRRNSSSEDVKLALSAAMARVNSFVAIHESIYTTSSYSAEIDVRQYLMTLTTQLQAALFPGRRVVVALDCAPGVVARDRVLNFGMIVAELVTNAAKHAFPDDRAGAITVSYGAPSQGPWVLSVSDDGIGLPDEGTVTAPGSGIGTRLVEAFATAAEGDLMTERLARGTRTSLTQARGAEPA